jgi:hypothetical protein
MKPELLFDAGNPPGSFASSPLMLVFALGLFLVAAFQFRNRRHRPEDPTVAGAHSIILALVAVGLAGFFAFNLWQSHAARGWFARGASAPLEGCVQDYDKVVHVNDHDITDTYFKLGGHAFHFNSSPWLPGYHDAGDVIHPGDRLRILTHGEKVLRVERLGSDCPAQSSMS